MWPCCPHAPKRMHVIHHRIISPTSVVLQYNTTHSNARYTVYILHMHDIIQATQQLYIWIHPHFYPHMHTRTFACSTNNSPLNPNHVRKFVSKINMCVHTHTRKHIHSHMHIRRYVYIFAIVLKCVQLNNCMKTYLYSSTCMNISAWACACMHARVHTWARVHTCTHHVLSSYKHTHRLHLVDHMSQIRYQRKTLYQTHIR